MRAFELSQIDAQTVSNLIASVTEAQAAQFCRTCSGGNPRCHDGYNGHYDGWSPAIGRDLTTHFATQGITSFSKWGTSSGNEFLLDFVLFEAEMDNGNPRNIVRTILGMEVEWDVQVPDAGSERDFNKLLCFNAPLKVFVYTCAARNRFSFEISIEQRLRQFDGHKEGDEYLIIEFYWRKTSWLRKKRLFRIQNERLCELPKLK